MDQTILPYGLSDDEFEALTGFPKVPELKGTAKVKAKPGEIIYDQNGKDTGERESPDAGIIQAGKGLVAGTGQAAVTTFPALYGLIGAGAQYLTGDKDQTFAGSMLSPDGEAKMREVDDRVINNIRNANPDFTDEQVTAKFDEVRKHSTAYYDELASNLRTGLSFASRWNKKINEFVGEKRLPSENTQLDSLYNIAGGLVPARVPASVAAKVASSAIGPALASKTGKLALNVAEISSPMVISGPTATGAQIAGRTAANIGVGEALDQGMRIAKDGPNFTDAFKTDDGSADWTKIAATGIGAIGTALAAYKMKYGKVVEAPVMQGTPAIDQLNKNLPNAVGETRMGLSALRDDLGAPETHLRGLGVDEGEIANVRNQQELNTGAMPDLDFERYFTTGTRSDLSTGTAPLKIRDAVEALEGQQPGSLKAFAEYDAIRNRLFDEDRAIDLVRKDVGQATSARAAALKGGNPAAIATATTNLTRLQTELFSRMRDVDPNLRPSIQDMSTKDARQRAADIMQQFPDVEKIHKSLRNEYKAYVDIGQREGLFSIERARQLKGYVDKGLTHFEDNPSVGKNWLDKKKVSLGEWWEDAKAFGTNTESSLDTFRGLHDRNPRKGYIDPVGDNRNYHGIGSPEPRPNTPYDPITQYAIQTMRTTKAIASNRAKNAYLQAAVNAPRNVPASGAQHGQFVTLAGRFTDKMFDNPAIKTKIDSWLSDRQVPHIGAWSNGEFNVYRISGSNGRTVRDALNFAPSATVPILNDLRKWSQFFLTGAGRPTFVLKAVPWDIAATALFRDTSKYTFGPVSQLAMKLFGAGSRGQKIFTNLGTAVDPWIMLARAIPTGIKRGTLAIYADSIARSRIEATGNYMLRQLNGTANAPQSATFTALTSIPGGQKLLTGVATTMAKGYEHSWYAMMNNYRIGHANNMVGQLHDILKSAETYGFGQSNGHVRQGWERYKSALSAMHDTSKELFFSQNYKRLMSAYNGAIPKAELDAFTNAVRKSSGDFQRHSGNQTVNAMLSTIRYGNVIFQTTKMIGTSIARDPVGTASRIALGVVLPKLMFDRIMTNWNDEARDYFWNQPNDKRIGTYFIPRPDVYVKLMAGEKVPFDPSQVYEVAMPPESLPFTIPVIHGLLAMGFISPDNYKGNQVPMDVNRDLGAAMDSAFGLTSPAFIGEIAASQGYDVRPGNLLRGDGIIRPMQDQQLMGVNKDKMSPGSEIPRSFYDVFNKLFGASMGAYIVGTNVAIETTERTKSKLAGVKAGAETAAIQSLSTMPFVNNLFPEYSKRFVFTPQAEEVGKVMHVLRDGIGEQYKVETDNRPGGGRPGRAGRVTEEEAAAAVAKSVDVPILADLVLETYGTFLKPTSEFGKLSTQRTDLKVTYDALSRGSSAEQDEAGRTRIHSPMERYRKANKTALDIAALDQARLHLYQEEWGRLVDEYGKTFAQFFGTSLTPESLIKAVRESSRRATLQVAPPNRLLR